MALTRCAWIVAGLLVVWGLKRHYADARADDLQWILGPTAHVVGVMSSTAFEFASGEGYLSRERLFLIEKSCAGINFLAAAFCVLMVACRHRVASALSSAGVLALCLLAGYAATVLVNAVRITFALWLGTHPLSWTPFTAADLHRLEGITVYFGGLVLLYEFAQRLNRGLAATSGTS